MPAPFPVNQQPQPQPPKYWGPFGPPPWMNGGPFGPPPGMPQLPTGLDPNTMDIGLTIARSKLLNNQFQQPIPHGMPGGESVYAAQKIAEAGASPFLGFGLAGIDAAQGALNVGQALGNFFTGTNFSDPRLPPQLQPSQELPVPGLTAPAAAESPLGPSFAQGLDGTTIIPGMLPPAPPKLELPEDFLPDYSKADARLEAGRPKPHAIKGTESEAGWSGAVQAAGQIDPYETNWAQALAQTVGGWQQGKENFRLRQEEEEIRAETQNRQYELMRAGVEEQRATADAQAHYNRTKLELDLLQQNFENRFKQWQADSPNVRVGDNGETIVQRRDEKGNIVIERSGFKDALEMQLALANAKSMAGKQGQYRVLDRAVRTGNIPGVINALTLEELGANNEISLLPPGSTAQQLYQKKVAELEQELTASGVTNKDMFLLMFTRRRLALLNEITASSPELEAYRAQALGLGQNLLTPRPDANTTGSPQTPTFTRGGAFPLPQ